MPLLEDDITYFENAADRFNDPEYDLLEVYFRVSRGGEKEKWSALDTRELWSRWARDVGEKKTPGLLNLYLHIPFCRQKCSFCHHYSRGRYGRNELESFLKSLKAQIDFYAPLLERIPVRNLSIGGGTPSVLSEGQLEALLAKMNERFSFHPDGERVCELNPASTTGAKLDILKNAGINRVSVGVQTLDGEVLKAVRREYQESGKVLEVLRACARRGFERGVHVDLLAGLDRDSPENFLKTCRRILQAKPDGVFVNALRPTAEYLKRHFAGDLRAFERHYGPFSNAVSKPLEQLAEDAGYDAAHSASDREWIFVRKGCRQDYRDGVNVYYEHSTESFSLLGLGSSAQSHVFGLAHYMQERDEGAFETAKASYRGLRFTIRDEMLKFVFTKLRYREEISARKFEGRFKRSFHEEFREAIGNGTARGFLIEDKGKYRLRGDSAREEFICGLYFAGREAVGRALGEDSGRDAVSNDVKNLELNVGMACNNRCVFCMSGQVEPHKRIWMPLDRAQRELLHFYNSGCRSVGFLGGEPSAYPHILDGVRYAKSLGYRRIALCSNGTKYSDRKFVESLLAAGVTRFTISIHSHLAGIEDELTGLPGNFERKLKGLRCLKKMLDKGRLPDNVSLNPVLNARTVPHMGEYIEFFRGEGFGDIRFNYIWPQARVEKDKSIIPRYRDAMRAILRVMLLNEAKWKMHITFGGLPPCMLRWGGRDLSPEMTEYLSVRYLLELDDPPTQTSLQGRERFDWNTVRGRKRNMLKTHAPGCERCPYFQTCEGVWKTYAAMYGLDEVAPLEPGVRVNGLEPRVGEKAAGNRR